jgi:hypothetical protein
MKKNLSITMMFVAFAATLMTACGKSGGDAGAPPVATVPTYGYVNGQCYNTVNNTPVAYNLCQTGTVTNAGYYWNGSQCLQTNTNTVVDPSLCNGNVNNTNNGWYQTGQGAGGPYVWTPYPNGHYPIGYFPTGYPSFPGYGGSGVTSQVCVGVFLWTSGGSSVTCNGWNCRGYFMYSQVTNRRILCL